MRSLPGLELAGGGSALDPSPAAGLLIVDLGDLVVAVNHVRRYWTSGGADAPALRCGDRALAKAAALAARHAHLSGVLADDLIRLRALDARARDHRPPGP